MPSSSSSFLRQLSSKETWKSTSNRWSSSSSKNTYNNNSLGLSCETNLNQMEGFNINMYGNEESSGIIVRKRVMVIVDGTSHSKHAMIWALTHVVNKGDLLTLLNIVSPQSASESYSPTYLVNHLGSICKDCKPEVEVEALVIQGPKLATVMSQVKKLEASILVLGQKKPSSFFSCLCGSSSSCSSTEEFVEYCINNAECLTIGVRKRSKGNNGYLISTRWQKNFWLLA
ncbi:adenine nucleotide alpha hydrolase superfamily protein [Trifolium pratense]|uniref:Adenine nucleotide alpha hydrolase superfamily protein n=1 Tax=Trifolium pratense TaxID=57577 RepID=A0A2K3LQX9_TRIPR|nr:adenine nucleotide alpha hydrolase superfamily protein [Trifolium pratense]